MLDFWKYDLVLPNTLSFKNYLAKFVRFFYINTYNIEDGYKKVNLPLNTKN